MNTRDEDKILRDGETLKVPHMMMDSKPQDVTPAPFIADNHMPHAAVLSDTDLKAGADRQAAYDKRLSDAWRNPEPAFVGDNFPQGGPGNVTPTGSGISLPTAVPGVVRAPGSPANTAELDALQEANRQAYNAKIEAAYKGAK
jgi:hypothetical protein